MRVFEEHLLKPSVREPRLPHPEEQIPRQDGDIGLDLLRCPIRAAKLRAHGKVLGAWFLLLRTSNSYYLVATLVD